MVVHCGLEIAACGGGATRISVPRDMAEMVPRKARKMRKGYQGETGHENQRQVARTGPWTMRGNARPNEPHSRGGEVREGGVPRNIFHRSLATKGADHLGRGALRPVMQSESLRLAAGERPLTFNS